MPTIESRDQLVASFGRGEKPVERWRFGTEHEKFVYARSDHHAPSYDEPGGIRDLLAALETMAGRRCWSAARTARDNVIALSGADGSVSLEPAGQFELSGAPLENLHQTCAETGRHLTQVKAVGETLGIGFLGLGMWPDKTRAELPVMPKGRYVIMRDHMPRVGTMGLDMMLRTCTIQVNLDYASEADMVKKFRVGLALQPLATALFANSPFLEGKPNGFLSYRCHIWSDTDPARTGMLPFVFEDGFGYERYTEYALDVPMYFVYRDGRYNRCRRPVVPRLPGRASSACCPARSRRWTIGTTTSRPPSPSPAEDLPGDARRGWRPVEQGSARCPPCGVGLLYDQGALDAAWDLVRDWKIDDRQALRDAVPKLALDAPLPGGGRLRDIAGQVLDIAGAGLAARARTNAAGDDETGFLEPLREIVRSGKVPAETLLDRYHGVWDGDLSKVYEDESF